MDKVTIVMSTYNTPKSFLDDSIESILRQTYRDIELIVVCDGSQEEYNYIVENFKDKRIRVLLNKHNMGLPFSLNLGISKASGHYIARMDSDDISLPSRIADEIRYLRVNGLDICGANAYLFGDNNGKKKLLFNDLEDIRVQLLFRATLIHPTVIGRKDIFEANKYNEDFSCSQDFELWSRLSGKYKIGNCNKCLLKYRVHKKQASIEKSKLQCEFSRKIISENSKMITGKYDKRIFKCLWYLSGREMITRENCKEFNDLIDDVVKKNNKFQNFDKKSFKRVLYNRFFEQTAKNKIIMFNLSALRKIIRWYNIKDFVFNILSRF